MTAKILTLGGSLRAGSFNERLARFAGRAARDAGAHVTDAALRDLPMPVYDADLEEAEGMPANAKAFKELLRSHDGLILGCPEYNSSITAALKNAIDWASRAESKDEPPLSAFRGKVVALLSASPGALGGLRGLVTVRSILGNIGCLVLPDQVAVPKAHQALGDDGGPTDERARARVESLAKTLVETTAKLR